jgi:hypothetical protein
MGAKWIIRSVKCCCSFRRTYLLSVPVSISTLLPVVGQSLQTQFLFQFVNAL